MIVGVFFLTVWCFGHCLEVGEAEGTWSWSLRGIGLGSSGWRFFPVRKPNL